MSPTLTLAESKGADRFKRDTANHEMTVLRDDGLYRHLRFKAPNTGVYWFDLIAWPGHLAFVGDMQGHVFARVEDMFTFFRRNGNSAGINPGYWSEKLVSDRGSVKRYSQEKLQDLVEEAVTEYEQSHAERVTKYQQDKARYDLLPRDERWPVEPTTPEDVRRLVDDHEDEITYRSGADELLRELEQAGVVSDSWEWDLNDWCWSFLWACHAIAWGIKQYDAERAPQTVDAAGAS